MNKVLCYVMLIGTLSPVNHLIVKGLKTIVKGLKTNFSQSPSYSIWHVIKPQRRREGVEEEEEAGGGLWEEKGGGGWGKIKEEKKEGGGEEEEEEEYKLASSFARAGIPVARTHAAVR